MSYKKFLKQHAYINGEWVSSKTQKTFDVINPYDGSAIAHVPDLGAEDAEKAIAAAEQAMKEWKQLTATERARYLKKLYALQMEHIDELAYILTLEQGKPLKEAKGEIKYGASFIEWFAEEARRTYGETIPSEDSGKRMITLKQPVGVVAAITPWNFPNAMITRKIAPALAAGCTVVVKPAEATPLSALALAVLIEKAGFPKGVVNVLTTLQAAEVGAALTSSPIVRKVSFTGSTAVGKVLMRQCADTVKKVSMELGGNAPFIVFEDADIDAAVEGLIVSKFRNAGQTCVCTNRVFVQERIYDAFSNKLSEAVDRLKMGYGLDDGVEIGPLIDKKATEKVADLVNDAVQKGASIRTKNASTDQTGNFYPPTVLGDVTPAMDLFHSEIFGCVAPLIKFKTESEVIAMANDTPYGLASYFYSKDHAKVWRVAEALEYGMVGVNTGMLSSVVAPFGGVKESGIGREGSKHGINDYLEIKYLCMGV